MKERYTVALVGPINKQRFLPTQELADIKRAPGLVGCLLIDEDGVYDPRRLVNDRLLLGMKQSTFSELELSILRQRSQEALRLKASRGDLHTSDALG